MNRNIFLAFFVLIGFSIGFFSPVAVVAETERLSALEKVYVSRFQTEGNTVFNDDELATLLATFTGRDITMEEMREASNRITQHYIDAGYVNSGAMIPDQDIANGTILLRVVEGRLTKVVVNGNTWLREGYVRKRLDRGGPLADSLLNVHTIQQRLKLLKQDDRIENVNAELRRGLAPGESELFITVEEAKKWYGWLEFNNHNSPSIGPWRGEIGVGHMNLTGWGDRLEAYYGITEGLDDYGAEYAFPVTRWDTVVKLEADVQESTIVADPFSERDIKSETTKFALGVRHPVYKTLFSEIALGVKFGNSKTKTFMDGEPFPFTGDDDGENVVSALRFTQEWVERSMSQVLAVHSSINYGLDAMGATILDTEPDGKFLSWLGQFQWIRRLDVPQSQLVCRFNLQWSDDPLLPAEKFGIGGASSVRGYRENLMTTDNGMIAGVEWRVPFWNLKIPKISKSPGDGELQVVPFFDYGKGWNNETPDPDTDQIYALGAGLRWLAGKPLLAEIYWGYALKDVENTSEHDIQDDGIHLRICGRF